MTDTSENAGDGPRDRLRGGRHYGPDTREQSGLLARLMGAEGRRLRARFLASDGSQGDTFDLLHRILRKPGGKRALLDLLQLLDDNPHWEPRTNSKSLTARMLHSASLNFCYGTPSFSGDAVTPAALFKLIQFARDKLAKGHGTADEVLRERPKSYPKRPQTWVATESVSREFERLAALQPVNDSFEGDCPAAGPWAKPERPRYTPSADEDITVNGITVRQAGERPNLYHYEWRTLQFLSFLFDAQYFRCQREAPPLGAYIAAVDACRTMFCGYLVDLGLRELAELLRAALTAARERPGDLTLSIRKATAVLR